MFKHRELLAAALLTGSCSNQVHGPADSLVGATNLPSAEVLSHETLSVTRGWSIYGGNRLAYELRPGGSLTITHTYSDDNSANEEVRARDTFNIRPEVAARFRRLMWRFRPELLEGQGIAKGEVRPLGCERRGPHEFGEVNVAFFDEGDAKSTKGNRLAVFELPQPDSCTTRAAKRSRETMKEALGLLPISKAVESFERAS